MKIIALAVLLSVMQANPPSPMQAPVGGTNAAQNVKHNSGQGKNPVAPPAAIKDIAGTESDTKRTPTENGKYDKDQTVIIRETAPMPMHRDWADWLAWGLNILLVGAGIAGVVAAFRTLSTIGRQTDALINSERSWIMTRIKFAKDNIRECCTYNDNGSFAKTTLNTVLESRNDGKTPAWILDQTIWCRTFTDDSPPQIPDTSDPSFVDSGFRPISIGRKVNTRASIDSLDRRVACSGRITIIYAVVKYRDVFGSHETRCGYVVKGDLGHAWLERMSGYDEYNKYS